MPTKHNLTDEQAATATQALYQRAERRVEKSPRLSAHRDFILADWPEGDEHWRWVIKARVSEIVDWAEAGQ